MSKRFTTADGAGLSIHEPGDRVVLSGAGDTSVGGHTVAIASSVGGVAMASATTTAISGAGATSVSGSTLALSSTTGDVTVSVPSGHGAVGGWRSLAGSDIRGDITIDVAHAGATYVLTAANANRTITLPDWSASLVGLTYTFAWLGGSFGTGTVRWMTPTQNQPFAMSRITGGTGGITYTPLFSATPVNYINLVQSSIKRGDYLTFTYVPMATISNPVLIWATGTSILSTAFTGTNT